MVPPNTAATPSWQRVLAVRLDNIGDAVLLGPALRAVRESLTDARIDLLCSPAGAHAAPLLPWLDDVWVERVSWQDARANGRASSAAEWGFVERLASRAYDAVLIFTSFSQTPYPMAYAALLAGIPVRAGLTADFGGTVLTHRVSPPPRESHQAERNLRLVEQLGFRIDDSTLEVRIPDEARISALMLLREHGLATGRYLLLAPGASAAARRYDAARFAQAAAVLSTEWELPVVLVGSERERALEPIVVARCPSAVSLVGRTSVPELAALVDRSRLVLTSHSLPIHLADALGRPVVVPFSGTDLPSQWQPRTATSRLLQRATACAPCGLFDCPIGQPCLDIPAAEVVRASSELLVATDEPVVPRRHHRFPGQEWIVTAS